MEWNSTIEHIRLAVLPFQVALTFLQWKTRFAAKMCVEWCNKSDLNYLYGGDQVNAVFQAIWFGYCFFFSLSQKPKLFRAAEWVRCCVTAEIEILIGKSACETSWGARCARQKQLKDASSTVKSSNILYIVNILIALYVIAFHADVNVTTEHCSTVQLQCSWRFLVLTIIYCNSWRRV